MKTTKQQQRYIKLALTKASSPSSSILSLEPKDIIIKMMNDFIEELIAHVKIRNIISKEDQKNIRQSLKHIFTAYFILNVKDREGIYLAHSGTCDCCGDVMLNGRNSTSFIYFEGNKYQCVLCHLKDAIKIPHKKNVKDILFTIGKEGVHEICSKVEGEIYHIHLSNSMGYLLHEINIEDFAYEISESKKEKIGAYTGNSVKKALDYITSIDSRNRYYFFKSSREVS